MYGRYIHICMYILEYIYIHIHIQIDVFACMCICVHMVCVYFYIEDLEDLHLKMNEVIPFKMDKIKLCSIILF